MADKIVTQDPTKPGILKVNGPTLTASNQLPLSQLDPTGASNGDVVTLVGGAWASQAPAGSSDTASNIGAGTGLVFKQKTGANFEFRSLLQGSNITITNNANDITIAASASGVGNIVIIQDQRPSGTSGGTAATAAWTTHVLNTEVADPAGLATIAANQVSLLAGTYQVRAAIRFNGIQNGKIRLRNITDGATLAIGQSVFAPVASQTSDPSTMEGRFTIAATKTLELQYFASSTSTVVDLGNPTSSGEVEVYADLVFLKE